MNSLTYILCKSKIEKKQYDSADNMKQMLDVFYGGKRISEDEYMDLINLMTPEPSAQI